MKRNQDVDYESLKNDLLNIDESFSKLNLKFDLSEYFNLTGYTGKSNTRINIISSDIERLTKQLIYYFYAVIKNFNYVDLYDKDFLESFKFLVKDEVEFNLFLNMTSLSIDDFLYIGVYICPNAFTSTLIKFIQTKYLNIKVVKKSRGAK